MTRFRNEDGTLTISIEEIERKTAAEARDYYKIGSIYTNQENGREYVYTENDGLLAHFQSFEGYNLFIPLDSLGTFLPGVADEGRELMFAE